MIEKLRNWLIKHLEGRAILIEVIVTLSFNFLYLLYLYLYYPGFLTTIKVSLGITDIIAILTLSIIAIGFLYYLGQSLVRGIQVNIKPSEQYKITFHGSLFCLGILLPLLFFSLLAKGQLEVFVFILVNSVLIVLSGWGNEKVVYPLKQNVVVTLITTDVDKVSETSNDKPREYSELYETRDTDYIFNDKNDIVVIPIAQVKEIRIHDNKNDKEFE